jgi:hypothetical protein
MKTRVTSMVGLTLVAAMTFGGVAPAAAKHEIVLGLQCDRTGAVQVVGVHLCPGYHDYVRLVNSKGGIEGHRIRALEIDHEYKVPQSIEAYERHKKEGVASARAIATRCCWPPDSWPGYFRACSFRPTRSRSANPFAVATSLPRPSAFTWASTRLSVTVMWGNSSKCWNTFPRASAGGAGRSSDPPRTLHPPGSHPPGRAPGRSHT